MRRNCRSCRFTEGCAGIDSIARAAVIFVSRSIPWKDSMNDDRRKSPINVIMKAVIRTLRSGNSMIAHLYGHNGARVDPSYAAPPYELEHDDYPYHL